MSKVDQLRQIREIRWSARQTHRAVPASGANGQGQGKSSASGRKPEPALFSDRAPERGAPQTAPQAAPPSTPAGTPLSAPPATAGRPARPDIVPGKPIHAYKQDDLVAMVRWVMSDGVERTPEQIAEQVMAELGFVRKGKNIRIRIGEAVTAAA